MMIDGVRIGGRASVASGAWWFGFGLILLGFSSPLILLLFYLQSFCISLKFFDDLDLINSSQLTKNEFVAVEFGTRLDLHSDYRNDNHVGMDINSIRTADPIQQDVNEIWRLCMWVSQLRLREAHSFI
ncbi:hypothetical protein M0R45_000512 [Rubus argutus]|uniref:Legume lectin domain-containing protein n=1 Tax=Rubus argutus TaxID=59490 RepID=A0AAW1VTT7_RUBAR